jgi:tetratricopeptide (TPR) repeat protein
VIVIVALVILCGLFACADFQASRRDPSGRYQCFLENGTGSSVALTSLDALYFTVGNFTTAGTGGVQPVSQFCRRVVIWQTVLGALVVLLGIGGVLWRVMTRPDRRPSEPERYERALAYAYRRQGDAAEEAGQAETALRLYEGAALVFEALTIVEPHNRTSLRDLTNVWEPLHSALLAQQRGKPAEQLARRGISLATRLAHENPGDIFAPREVIGWHLRLSQALELRDDKQARDALQTALAGAEALANAVDADIIDRRNLIICLDRMSWINMRLGLPTPARTFARKALKVAASLARANPADTTDQLALAGASRRMAEAVSLHGEPKRAAPYYRKALRIFKRILPPDSEETTQINARLAELD